MLKKKNSISKGAPSGFVVSLLLHAGAFVVAGLLVVFSVTKKEEKKFVPPTPVERPKMKLKKPQVKVKKNAKPKSSSRIVTKVNKAKMPDIQLPELGGMGEGFGGGAGVGFELSPDIEGLSMLGSTKSIGSDLEGTFYDFSRTRTGSSSGADVITWREDFRRFLLADWNVKTLAKYYRLPQKLYATSLVFPPAPSSIAPSAFGDRDASGAFWLVHYKGQIVHREGIRFRFWANADENLIIRVNGKIVIAVSWVNVESGEVTYSSNVIAGLWETSDAMQSRRFFMGNNRAVVGDWITLEPGIPQDIEIAIGDNGGQACFMVAVEEEGVEYPKTYQGGPLLPAFKTAEISRDMQDLIMKNLVADEISLTNGPVFNDYASSTPEAKKNEQTEPVVDESVPEMIPREPTSRLRSWMLTDTRSFEAEFINVLGFDAVFRNSSGKTVKLPLANLSEADRNYIELSRPPKLNIDFTKINRQKTFAMEHASTSTDIRVPETRVRYGVRLRQTSAGDYNHELKVEFFAIGQERLGQKYILLDRRQTSFTPTKDNNRTHEFISDREVVLENFMVENEPRGETYSGYLVVVTDERGEVIAVEASTDRLIKNLENLKKLKPGNYMDKQCIRVYPTQPPRTRY
ncbi:hypothetical protein P4C99_21195 [Pontiellaceae bacterium B1224]|nr:hypothetical protein [Pontiellaceae bacterium B1224]